MKYSIKTNLHCDKNVFKENKLANRSYFIPFEEVRDAENVALTEERYKSSRVFVMNENWEIKYYKSFNDIPEQFETSELGFNAVRIPSTWQRTGYEEPWYLNTRYQFKMRPPIIDKNIPAAVYHNTFSVNDMEKRYTLTFLGVCSSCAVYINGSYVGYAEGSHDMNEFDVTSKLIQGINDIVVIVTKFCNGSYLECQDMFRENGIFRDVYITEYYPTDITDIGVTTFKNEDGSYDLEVLLDIANMNEDTTFKIVLYDDKNNTIASKSVRYEDGLKIQFASLNVEEWSAEIPKLYKLMIIMHCRNSVATAVRQYVGFKDVRIDGEVFLVNGKPIKLLGVNHHDTDAINGWVMTAEELERDVKIIKEYNCNAVRMSHYPPDPILLSLCDKYGLYVIDEADIECHNIYSNVFNQRYGRISNRMYWRDQFIERVDNMYMRDRNHPSIVMWSLGNEAGGYYCHDEAYYHLKDKTSIPIHYEGVIHTKRHSYDVISQMYAHSPKVQAIGEHKFDKKFEGKPYFLCEYAHAMGVGPGALDEYVKLFYKHDNLMGGCIWEFADHVVYDENAKYKYTYGGDHNEPKHDGNFCVDGMFRSDRTPSSGALNMKAVYRPVCAERITDGKYRFINRRYFKNASDIALKWQYLRNGEVVNEGVIDSLDIEPQCFIDTDIAHAPIDNNADGNIVFTYINAADNSIIATEQIVLNEVQYDAALTDGKKLEVTANKKVYTVKHDCGSIIYDAATGEMLSYTVRTQELFNQAPSGKIKGFQPGINRAMIDNDRFIYIPWGLLGYNRSETVFEGAKVRELDGCVVIDSKYKIKGLGVIAKCGIIYTVSANGSVKIDVTFKRGIKMLCYSDIPRAGVALELANELENVEYYGMGSGENLSDMNDYTTLGVFNDTVSGMEEFYVKPQDSGNRTAVRYVKLTKDDGKGLQIIHCGNYFNFRVKHYALNDILGAKHIEDVPRKDTTCVYIDGAYRGAGSQSCGQQPLDGHRPNLKKPIKYSFIIKPIV